MNMVNINCKKEAQELHQSLITDNVATNQKTDIFQTLIFITPIFKLFVFTIVVIYTYVINEKESKTIFICNINIYVYVMK